MLLNIIAAVYQLCAVDSIFQPFAGLSCRCCCGCCSLCCPLWKELICKVLLLLLLLWGRTRLAPWACCEVRRSQN